MKTAFPTINDVVSIRLYSNIPFDNTYSHHSLISSKFKYNGNNLFSGADLDDKVKQRFIDRKDYTQTGSPYYYPRYDLTDNFNFDFSNGLNTTLTLELTPEQTNANYLRVKTGKNNIYEYYYYFITSIKQCNASTYKLTLELDVLMTYQDEFLDGMKGVPVFTERKHSHRYTADGLRPYCCDLKAGEETFAGVKPSLVKKHHQATYYNSQMKKLEGVMWLYLCVDGGSRLSDIPLSFLYTCVGKTYPFFMFAIPINVKTLTYKGTGGTTLVSFDEDDFAKVINALVGSGYIHGAKVSPYPPFKTATSITYTAGNLTIQGSHTDMGSGYYKLKLGNNELLINSVVETFDLLQYMAHGCVAITEQKDVSYTFEDIDLEINNLGAPAITYNRYQDPKLLFAPFRKYVLNAQYCTNGYEIYPELLYSQDATTSADLLNLIAYTTSYIGDNNIFISPTFTNSSVYQYTEYEKIGLASAVNYTFPVGINALDEFNATQRQSFYTSKVASGITSGIGIAGGVASIGAGIGALASGYGAPIGVSLIAGGTVGVAGGIAGVVNTVKSYNAKMEDLKNTPDSVNISGSNFIFDDAVAGNSSGLPYVDVYECANSVKENADDYFYNYGYQTSRECYFNEELKIDNSNDNFIDNNLFGRSIFNYIKLNEDITCKINANIPYIIKQKISAIFNQGVTLWNFFGFGQMWAVNPPANPSSTYYLDNWFMKCTLDNTEYSNETHN